MTVTTYRHPLLTNSSGKNPSMVGPLFIHQQKKFASYNFFASSLVGLNSKLKNIHAFGTDGEKALFDAFTSVFTSALHVRCFLHFRGNLEAKLSSLGIPKEDRIEFLHDVFGNPSKLEEGLVDAADEQEFETTLSEFQKIWNAREEKYNNPPQFYNYFVANCQEAVQTSMLKPHRVHVGLGDSLDPYYTNDVESFNKVIKKQVKYKAQELPQFISLMSEMVENQKKEIEKAIVNMGEYRIIKSHQHLCVDKQKNFQMNITQCEKHLKRIFQEDLNSSSLPSAQKSPEDNPLLTLTSIPVYVLNRAWEGSEHLSSSSSTSSNICLSPGCSSRNEWLVKSGNPRHKQPYFVECKPSGQIVCETGCASYSSAGLCMHTVAVARYMKKIESLVEYLRKKKQGVNISQLCNVDMPNNCGQKPQSKAEGLTESE